jgi:hypothetical protein
MCTFSPYQLCDLVSDTYPTVHNRITHLLYLPVLLCSASGSFVLLDGDKIAALAAVYLRQLLSHAPPGTSDSVQIGVVQTAYANGASTHFLTEKLGLKVGCTNTGGGVCLAFEGCMQALGSCSRCLARPGQHPSFL